MMERKKRSGRALRLLIDIWMTFGLMFSMGYQLFAPDLHEWSGTVLLVLFIIHHLLNRGWYGSLFRGRYSVLRSLIAATDLALLVFIVILMWSGIAMSQYVFTFLPASGGMSAARRLHLLASVWAYILLALHLGLHWHAVFTASLHLRERTARALLWAGGAVACYGVYVFIARDFVSNMFLLNEFAFLDYDESPLLFYIDYLAVFGLFIFLGNALRLLLSRRKEKRTLRKE
ncbi:MAG: DUF4405 domain-containing protein [Clostridia bacterium]|nr:DUF4405 domain-containing protein [Clostridia bacterium]